jgi:hypothetical protein
MLCANLNFLCRNHFKGNSVKKCRPIIVCAFSSTAITEAVNRLWGFERQYRWL